MQRYHHGDLRAALIAAGLEMARERGSEALGMRELSRAVGVSPTAAYRHFASLRELVLAVAREARTRLSDTLGERMGTAAEPADRLRAFGSGYLAFARAEPGWFLLTCDSSHVPPGPGRTPHELLLETLDAMTAAGVLSAANRAGAEWSCWSAIHGLALLATTGPLRGLPGADVTRLGDRVVGTLIRGLTTDP